MSLLEIKTFPDDVLRHQAEPVEDFNEELHKLVEDMVETMRDAPGVGLAAPQIGVSKQLIVVEFGDEEDEEVPKQLFIVANPEIIRKSKDSVKGIEGCLSVPGVVGEVERSTVVTVSGQDKFGKKIKIRAQGWLARIFQHEIDHVNGMLYTDRAENLWQPDSEDLETI
jgi:peptide deformylase